MKTKLFVAIGIITLYLLSPLFWKGGGREAFAQNSRLWGTYYGGTASDRGSGVAADASGNIYMAGTTDGASGIASAGFQNTWGGPGDNAFLVKFDAAGNRLWATYYGGSGTGGMSVATDASGNVYLVGVTGSLTGIASGGFQNTLGGGTGDAFLVKFDAGGNRLWATYYGGLGEDRGNAVASDVFGNVYLGGSTSSTNGIASGGFQNTDGGGNDAFLVKFDANGRRLWATYYGGEDEDNGNNVATDALGNVYLTGATRSANGIASGGFQNIKQGAKGDAFLVKFNTNGNRLWATYYGGPNDNEGWCAAADASGNIYLGGWTDSPSGIAAGGFQNVYGGGVQTDDAFLVKFDASGSRLWATYYGGDNNEEGNSITTDACGNVYLAGNSFSANTNNCIASGGFQNTLEGTGDAFVVKFNAGGARLCATYYGETLQTGGAGIATDIWANVYLAGLTNSTTGIASGGFQNSYGGGTFTFWDAYLVKFTSPGSPLTANVVSADVNCNGACSGTGTATPTSGNGLYIYSWSNVQTASLITGLCAGTYTVTITDCTNALVTKTITITEPIALTVTITSTGPMCNQGVGSATVNITGGAFPYTQVWSNGQTTTTAVLAAGTHTAMITDKNACNTAATIIITEPAAILLNTSSTPSSCILQTGIVTATVSAGGTDPYVYSWNTGHTTQSVTGLGAGTYTITITDASGCTQTQAVIITTISTPPMVSVNATTTKIAPGESTQLNAIGGGNYLWTPATSLSCSSCFNPMASPAVTTSYCVEVTDANGCTAEACVTIDVEILCAEFFVPTAFSPNEDASNNLLCIYGTDCIKSLIFSIYNRWGNKVFETNDPKECWNGKYSSALLTMGSGTEMNETIFAYYFKATLQNKKVVIKRGNITLIK